MATEQLYYWCSILSSRGQHENYLIPMQNVFYWTETKPNCLCSSPQGITLLILVLSTVSFCYGCVEIKELFKISNKFSAVQDLPNV